MPAVFSVFRSFKSWNGFQNTLRVRSIDLIPGSEYARVFLQISSTMMFVPLKCYIHRNILLQTDF